MKTFYLILALFLAFALPAHAQDIEVFGDVGVKADIDVDRKFVGVGVDIPLAVPVNRYEAQQDRIDDYYEFAGRRAGIDRYYNTPYPYVFRPGIRGGGYYRGWGGYYGGGWIGPRWGYGRAWRGRRGYRRGYRRGRRVGRRHYRRGARRGYRRGARRGYRRGARRGYRAGRRAGRRGGRGRRR